MGPPNPPARITDLLAAQAAAPPAGATTIGDQPVPSTHFRLTVDLPRETAGQLDALAARDGASHADAVARAVATVASMNDAVDQGATLLLRQPSGALVRLAPLGSTASWTPASNVTAPNVPPSSGRGLLARLRGRQ